MQRERGKTLKLECKSRTLWGGEKGKTGFKIIRVCDWV